MGIYDILLSGTVAINDQSMLQITIDGIKSWRDQNDMVLNVQKCKEILFCFGKRNLISNN